MNKVAVASGDNIDESMLRSDGHAEPCLAIGDISSRSPSMEKVLRLIERASKVSATVLIVGESGTGKDVAANTIHRCSARRDGPFVAINCAAIPETLVEAELFGYEKGAFTGASGSRVGRFQAAEGGSLFIDEIGDLPLTLQAKLLRVLETRVVTPLGGHREIPVDVRIIAATNRNLPAMVANNLFREDLFYRLNVIAISLPPLRERLEDLEALAYHFLERVNARNGTAVNKIASSAWELLRKYHWPGNIRELLNVIERGAVLCSGNVLRSDDIPHCLATGGKIGLMPLGGMLECPGSAGTDDFPTLENLESVAISSALVRFANNRTRAANALGISVRTLQRKIAARIQQIQPGTNGAAGHSR